MCWIWGKNEMVFYALIREFVGYLRLTWKKHALVIGIVASIVVATNIAGWLR